MSVGGYDVEVTGDVSKDFYCVICMKLMKDAIQMECGHGMCNGCFQMIVKSSKERNIALVCPSCGTDIAEEKIMSVPMINRIIQSLNVKCSNTEHGCVWVGILGDMKDHLLMHCEHEPVACSFDDCDVKVLRLNLAEHEEICEYRWLSCEYCSNKVVYKALPIHIRNCEYYQVMCPIPCCNMMVPQCQMTDHLNNCPFDEVECTYRTIGCSAMVLQKDLNQHFIESVQPHLMLMMDDNLKNKEIIANLQNDCVKKAVQIDNLQNDAVKKAAMDQLQTKLYDNALKIDDLQKELNKTKHVLQTTTETLESVTKELNNMKLQEKSSTDTELLPECNKYINEMCSKVEEIGLEQFNEYKLKLLEIADQEDGYLAVQKELICRSPFQKRYEGTMIVEEVQKYIANVTVNTNKVIEGFSINDALRRCRSYFASSCKRDCVSKYYMDDLVGKLQANIEKRYMEIYLSNCNILKKYALKVINNLQESLMIRDRYVSLQDKGRLDFKNCRFVRQPLSKLGRGGVWLSLINDPTVFGRLDNFTAPEDKIRIDMKDCEAVWLLKCFEVIKAKRMEGGNLRFNITLKELKSRGYVFEGSVVFGISN